MNHVKLFLILFVLFLIQGTVMTVFSPEWFGFNMAVIPHFILVAVMLIAFFLNRGTAVKYGVVFGFLIDIIYTNVWGVYAFCIAFTAYLMSYLTKVFHMNLIVVLFISMIGVCFLELEVYGIYSIVGLTNVPFVHFLEFRLPPTAALNGVFTIIAFYPMRRFLGRMREGTVEE
ncbi:rod shape-determining protein MreD [Scopulibacillus cellulosilyticus]|uniref:Rod shape-determining protein MreD n=1 Tax=Scopulibacillus cellulosilyticus TaxID=2665665 RepID=A0ABW2PUY2_9BACL